jgi:hypothetical protein
MKAAIPNTIQFTCKKQAHPTHFLEIRQQAMIIVVIQKISVVQRKAYNP